MFESFLLYKIANETDATFSFRHNHSTDECIFALKGIARFYNDFSSPIALNPLNASKAFDRVKL
jgi:hypothetical protein